MGGHGLTGARIAAVNRGLPRIEQQLRVLTRHVRMLASIGEQGSMDGRDLLRCVAKAKNDAMMLRHDLGSLAQQAASVRRTAIGQDAYGQFQANVGGLLRNIDDALAALERAIRDLELIASERIGDPGRWGDAAAATPVAELISLLQTLLEIWRLERVRYKLT